ncbi:MAG: ABC transporter substrate-binding protein [Devosia sp.]
MFNRRTLLALAGATAILGASSFAMAEDKPYVAIISKGFSHQFWQAVKLGAEKAATEFNVDMTFEGPDGEGAVDRQLDMLQAALAKHPGALGIAAIDSQATVPVLQQYKDAGIPVIAFDSGVASDIPISSASTDNLASVALAADKMAELIGGEGEVAILAHDQTSQTGIERRDGFVNQIKAKYPKITIVDIQYVAGGDHALSADATKTMLLAHPNLKGIFATNEGTAIGLAIGKRESGSKIVAIGYDSGAEQLAAIRDGTLAGSITQNPVGIGYETVKAAVMAIKGEAVPAHIDTGFYWYDKTNIDDPIIKPNLYE